VLIVDDHEVVARGLALLLGREGLEIAGTAGDLERASKLLERRQPKVALVDLDLGRTSGLELIPVAHAAGARVLVYTGDSHPRLLAAARAAGADGIASKASSLRELLEAVRTVCRGEYFVDRRFKQTGGSLPLPTLTSREREVVTLLAGGLTGEEIAFRLSLSPETVRTHIRNAMNRLGARTRAHLVTLAVERHEIELPRQA
jgi:DNA-binding NarL/FixJ family response regulator